MDDDLSGNERSEATAPEDTVESDRLTGYVFAVNRTPYCSWEWDLEERNLRFLESLDTGYYGYVADLCISELESDSKLSASIVLRGAYHQAVETLVSLLGAYVQAPEAVPAWLTKASTLDLEEVAQLLLDGRPLLTQGGRQSATLDQLGHHVHQFCWTDESGPDSTAARYGRFWRLLCRDRGNAGGPGVRDAVSRRERLREHVPSQREDRRVQAPLPCSTFIFELVSHIDGPPARAHLNVDQQHRWIASLRTRSRPGDSQVSATGSHRGVRPRR